MKRESETEETVFLVKKPRLSKSSDESPETLSSSGGKESGTGIGNDGKETGSGEILGSVVGESGNANDVVAEEKLNVIDISSDESDDEKVILVSKNRRILKSSDESPETLSGSGDKESGFGVENGKKETCSSEILGSGVGESGNANDTVVEKLSVIDITSDESDDEKLILGSENRRILKSSYESPETSSSSGDKESGSGVENGKKETATGEILGSGVGGSGNANDIVAAKKLNVIDITSDESDDEKVRLVGVADVCFYVNVPTLEAGESGNDTVAEEKLNVIYIPSNESDDEKVILVRENSSVLKTEVEEHTKLSEVFEHLSVRYGALGRPRTQESIESRNENTTTLRIQESESRAEMMMREAVRRSKEYDLMIKRQTAVGLARCNSKEHHSEETVNLDANLFLGDGPFSGALRNIVEQNVIEKSKSVIDWSPSIGSCRKNSLGGVPSLLDLSLKELAKNAAAIVSLESIPYILRKRLADLICNSRSMNAKTLDLFVRGSPSEICIKDCHWLTQDQFSTSFKNIDEKNLVVLQLELCGQCNFDYIIGQTFAGSVNSLPNLAIISLKGASRLTDYAVKALVRSAPTLQSINLSQCSLLTEKSISFIADAIGTTLKELYIDGCPRLQAMLIETALLKLKKLEVLSVAGIETVCDKLVEGVVTVCGKTLKHLNLADCPKLTNYSLEVIASTCSSLHSLNISKLYQLTDMSLKYLANGCQLVQSLTLHGNRFSDEVIAAFLETSGMSLKNLSLNNVSKVGCNTAMSLAKHSRGLLSLDLSWCRRVSNEELGLIVDRCLSLRLLKLFGCSQITNVFLNGHSNTQVQIVGVRNTPLLTYMDELKPEEHLLRYSEIHRNS